MSDSGKKEDNPIVTLWRLVSVPLGIIDLAGLSDNIVAWQGFIDELVVSYQSVVHPVFRFLFGWVPFDVPSWVFDYLTVGLLVNTTFFRSVIDHVKGFRIFSFDSIRAYLWLGIVSVVFLVIGWPVSLFGFLEQLINEEKYGDEKRQFAIVFWKWFGAILLGFVLLLIVNYALLTL